jgi:hypothetical protein
MMELVVMLMSEDVMDHERVGICVVVQDVQYI